MRRISIQQFRATLADGAVSSALVRGYRELAARPALPEDVTAVEWAAWPALAALQDVDWGSWPPVAAASTAA